MHAGSAQPQFQFLKMCYKNCRRFCLCALVLCAILYYFMDTITDTLFYERRMDIHGYFVKTTGCHMLAMSPLPYSMLKFWDAAEPMVCNRTHVFRAETLEDQNYLAWDMTEQELMEAFKVKNVSEIGCMYRHLKRYNDGLNLYVDNKMFKLNNETKFVKMKPGQRMVVVKCMSWRSDNLYHDVHFFLPPPTKPKNVQQKPQVEKKLSVLILGVDSVSHMHMLRSMISTVDYITSFPHVEFSGYNRVGRNSYPNVVPLLSGLNVTELELSCYQGRPGTRKYDNCDLLWKHFKDAGYNTSFGEDTSYGGTFTCGKEGFLRQPTDYYLRPVLFEIHSNTRYDADKRGDIHCTGNRLYAAVLEEFIYKLLPHMQQRPFFSFFWRSQGVHDYFNYAELVDKDYLRMFRRFHNSGIMNHTLILFMSDHGMRFGRFRETYQGMQEESQPTLLAIYPAWLDQQYPLAMSNLKSNAYKLVTNFDVHATLKDLLKLDELRNEQIKNRTVQLLALNNELPRGISLFLPVPEQRDCAMAGIPAHFCLCQQLQDISIKDQRVRRAANFIVHQMNELLRMYNKCAVLKLNAIKAAYLLEKPWDKYQYEIKVRVETKPGFGMFEGTMLTTGNELALDGVVTRINRYGNQSYCVNDYHIEMYCYCIT